MLELESLAMKFFNEISAGQQQPVLIPELLSMKRLFSLALFTKLREKRLGQLVVKIR